VLRDNEYYFKPLSGNGANVIGSSNAESGRAPFRWFDGTMANIGTLGGSFAYPVAISFDRTVVAGNSAFNSDSSTLHAFLWKGGVMSDLGTLNNELSYAYSSAIANSAVGKTVVGASTVSSTARHAFRWNNGIMHDLGTLYGDFSNAYDVSADGSVVVGAALKYDPDNPFSTILDHAVRWVEGDIADLCVLGQFSYGFEYSGAQFVSADGSVAAGFSSTNDDDFRGFRWADGEMVDIGSLGGNYASVSALSSDGTTLVGDSRTGLGHTSHAYLWQNGAMLDLGVSNDDNFSTAVAVSADGSVVVGRSVQSGMMSGGDIFFDIGPSLPASPVNTAFRWTETTGMTSVADWITSVGGSVPLGYSLTEARDVSADGKVIVGNAKVEDDSSAGYHSIGWLARDTGGFLSDTDAFNLTLIDTSTAGATSALLAISGAHHRTLLDTPLAAGANGLFAWTAADAARNDALKSHTALGKVGLGADLAGYRLGAAFGSSSAKQDSDRGGNARINRRYILAEVVHDFATAGESVLRASLLGF
jgi:probable HAF family extracellular repeat protein